MKCDDCVFALWDRTKKGWLHSNKLGRCGYFEQHPFDLRLPAAFFWFGSSELHPSGGMIERGIELRSPCAFYSQLKEERTR